MFPKGTNEEVWIEAVKGAAVDQDALQLSVYPTWKIPRTFWHVGKVSWWQTGATVEGTEERWKRCCSSLMCFKQALSTVTSCDMRN